MKLDTSTIAGYETMSAEEKIAALEAFEIAEPTAKPADNGELERAKQALSKANSEAAEYKRQLKAKMTESEQAEAARAEADKALREELATLRRERTESGYNAKFLENGFDAETAAKMAKILPDGVTDEFFSAQKAFIENAVTKAKGDALNSQSPPSAGLPVGTDKQADDIQAKLFEYAGIK